MSERSPSLTLTDVANLAGVGVSAASNWRKRHADFPSPTMTGGQELFAPDEIARWLSQRKIARNGLRAGEAPGATYGDRFIRNGGASLASVQAEMPRVPEEERSGWTSQLWRIVDLLRSNLDHVAALDFIMAMLYLRTTDTGLWRAVTEQHSWDVIGQMLRNTRFRHYDTPLFPAMALDLYGQSQLTEAIELFDDINLEKVGSAVMFDALLENINRDLGRHGGHFTPSSVVKCMIEILNPQNAYALYDPSCGSGELLVAAAQRGVKSLFGQAINGRSFRMSLLNLSMHGSEAQLRVGGPEIMRTEFAAEQFDVVVSNPPFNNTLPDDIQQDGWPFRAPSKSAANFAWLQLAVHHLKPGGRAAILMPNGTLFAGGLSAEIRRSMIEAGTVEAIISFPAGLFAATGISVSLWLLRRPKSGDSAPPEILFVDATSMGATGERAQRLLRDNEVAEIVQVYRDWRTGSQPSNFENSFTFARSVGLDEIRQNDYDLQPRRYVHEETAVRASIAKLRSTNLISLQRELDKLSERARHARHEVGARLAALHHSSAAGWHNVSLGDICDIHSGPGTVDRKRGLTTQGWTPLVLPRNIKRGYLSHNELDTIGPDVAAKLGNYVLRAGDIVCVRSGTLGRHGLVRKAEHGWILGPSCMRLRPFSHEVHSNYLVHYLNSPDARNWIAAKSGHSTVIPHISAATMRELVIPLPALKVQQEIVDLMDLIDVNLEQHELAVSAIQSFRDLIFPSLMQP
ncbi:N-6 DNA methylase [Dactylosporangium aurantiacum]|uniref:site-specific DNA-methyltransferase (adenine-specific) n=1 Tax=Dactylosporangium aurantiacum TaxID=35754 RepID=A0A9Q9MGX2_9ACTN|nr:type I restriction-modification system subunit M/S [Dactylosporangium aurantiacum]MDG6109617.1 N-6 DNA methylase [Dactylosporangium aurantiacum]UWZ54235.1 N-6 DNA methylase [Dactylosporangium aurantiacum]